MGYTAAVASSAAGVELLLLVFLLLPARCGAWIGGRSGKVFILVIYNSLFYFLFWEARMLVIVIIIIIVIKIKREIEVGCQ